MPELTISDLMTLFEADLMKKINAIPNVKIGFTKKIKGHLHKHLLDSVRGLVFPPLLPSEYNIEYRPDELNGLAGVFRWERDGVDHSFRFLIGTTAKIDSIFKKLVLRNFFTFASLENIRKAMHWRYKYDWSAPREPNTYPDCDTHTQFDCDSCPVCLDAFDDNNVKKTTNCGHPLCLSCFTMVCDSHQKDCPICRASYISNSTMIEGQRPYSELYKNTGYLTQTIGIGKGGNRKANKIASKIIYKVGWVKIVMKKWGTPTDVLEAIGWGVCRKCIGAQDYQYYEYDKVSPEKPLNII